MTDRLHELLPTDVRRTGLHRPIDYGVNFPHLLPWHG